MDHVDDVAAAIHILGSSAERRYHTGHVSRGSYQFVDRYCGETFQVTDYDAWLCKI